MRVEPYFVDSIIHITKRGTRGMNIVRDDDDRGRFTQALFYLNDSYTDIHWHEAIADLSAFERPQYWPEQEPLTRILGWTLLSNHFHLLVQEIMEGGTAKFMQRLGGSMSLCFNLKYGGKGSIFQSAYQGKVVKSDAHINYLAFYILVKNVLEMYPGGLKAALVHFDDAWEWAVRYPFSSLAGAVSGKPTPVVDDIERLLAEIIGTGKLFKKESKELLEAHISSHGDDFKDVMLESW
jgi:hypothetical protein